LPVRADFLFVFMCFILGMYLLKDVSGIAIRMLLVGG